MVGPIQYTRQVVKEAKRVRWPKTNVLVVTVVTVLIITIFFALVLIVEDLAAGSLLQSLTKIFQNWGK